MNLVKHYVLPGYENTRLVAVEQETIADFLTRAEWEFKLPTICVMNGTPVLRREWATTTISDSDNILFYSKPHGGGGGGGGGGKAKTVLGLVALVALAAFAPWVAGSMFASGTFGFYAVTSAIMLGGGLLVSSFLQPQAASNSNDKVPQLYSLSASGNTANPFQVIPVQYGRLKVVPPYAALPWTDYEGDDAYLNVLLAVGQGKYSLEQILVDDTPLWNTNGFTGNFTNTEIQYCNPGDQFTLFPANVIASSEVNGQEVRYDSTQPVGWYAANNAGTVATNFVFDFVFPAGLQERDSKGNQYSWSVTLIGQLQAIDAAGSPTGPIVTAFTNTVTWNTTDPKRYSVNVQLSALGLAAGRYQVRVWRHPAYEDSSQITDQVLWAQLRVYLNGPTTFPSSSVLGIRMKATSQLSNQSAKQFGIISTRILPVWNGTAFVDQATKNAWWALYDAATNQTYGVGWPVNKIDFQTIVDQASAADTRGDSFNYVFNSEVTYQQAFDTILQSNRSKVTWLGDVLSVTRDEWKPIPSTLLSDQQIVRGTLEVDYIMNTMESSDCVQGQFLNEDTWQPAQLQYPPNSDTFTAKRPSAMHLDGITNATQMFNELRFWYKQSQLRRINIRLDTEHDGRLLRFGSPVKVQSFLPKSWGASGEIVSYNSTTKVLTINRDDLYTTAPGPYFIELRSKTGGYFGPVQCSFVSTTTILLDSTDLAQVESNLGMTIDTALTRMNGAEPPSFVFGLSSNLSRNCIVLSGKAQDDKVSLELVVDSAAVHDTSGGTQPIIPTAPAYADPRVPLIGGLLANFKQGVAEPIIAATWWPAKGAVYYKAQVSYDSGNTWLTIRDNLQDPMLSEVVSRANLRLRVCGVGIIQGPWASVDVTVPNITVADGVVTVNSFEDGLKDYVANQLAASLDNLSKVVQQIASIAAEIDAAGTTQTNTLRSTTHNLQATVTTFQQAYTNSQQAFATYQTQVTASIDTVNASVSTNSTAIADVQHNVNALYTLTLDVNGRVSGFQSVNNGTTADFVVLADNFVIGTPTIAGGASVPVFQIGTVGGVAKLVFHGDLFGDGTVTASAISVATLSSISANIGTITAGKIQSASGQFIIDATNERIEIWS